MAFSTSSSVSVFTLAFLTVLLSNLPISHQQPILNSAEQDSVYQVLESINADIPWRSIFPDDLCTSAPHGVVCEYFIDDNGAATNVTSDSSETPHITELSLGYVSDYSPNAPCTPNSTFSPTLFTAFTHLRKLFFYKCFTGNTVSVPNISPSFGSTLEELVFFENPSLVGSLSGVIRYFTGLRRLVLIGNGFSGEIPDVLGELTNLEQVTITGNQLNGEVPRNLSKLKKMKLLDLSHSNFDGNVPDSIGRMTELAKLDLSYNRFTGKILEMKDLQRLEFLDLSFNRFGNFGIPLSLGEIPRLREVYLSGNLLGGQIPEIWSNLGGVLRLGLSGMGLVGKIPNSMGVHLRNLCYLGLGNNKLEGAVPEEFGFLEFVSEMNLENNKLSGRIPFSGKFTARVGEKLKLEGNPGLCMDDSSNKQELGGHLKACNKSDIPSSILVHGDGGGSNSSSPPLLLLGLFWVLFRGL